MEALTYVQPADIRGWWSVVKPGLEVALADEDAIPEEVYVALVAGNAQLFVGTNAGRYLGFVICTREKDALFIWVCYSPKRDVAVRFFPRLLAIAEGGGMTKLRFGSASRGWGRLAARYGFRPVRTIYEAEV